MLRRVVERLSHHSIWANLPWAKAQNDVQWLKSIYKERLGGLLSLDTEPRIVRFYLNISKIQRILCTT